MSIFTELLRSNAPRGEKAMLDDILIAVRMALGFPLACLIRHDGARVEVIAVSDARGADVLIPGRCDPHAETYFQMLRDAEIPQILPNTLKDELARLLPWIRTTPVGAAAGIPFQDETGQTTGALCCFSPVPSDISAKNIRLMTVLARIAANILDSGPNLTARTPQVRDRIRNVIKDARVDIHLQPIVDLKTSNVRGYEALSRFQEDGAPSAPLDWFKDAETVGMKPLLECTAIAEAVQMLPFLPEDTYLSVNASPETVEIGAVADIVQNAPTNRIMLDLSEHAAADAFSSIDVALAELRSLGMQIALDNFGAGDLNMPVVARLKPDILKLDLSLVKSINRDQHSQELTRAIVKFADQLGAVLIAVGIEHESERATLADLGVPFGQGFLLAKPDAPEGLGLKLD